MAKNKGGRPSEYTKDILKLVKEYLSECQDEEIQLVKQANSEKGYEMYENKLKVNLPTIEGLAIYLGINRDTIYDWCTKHPEFSDMIDRLRMEQSNRLINNGLTGDYQPMIVKLLLGKHGYKEQSETDLTSKGEKLPSAVQITGMQIVKDSDADNVQNKKPKTA